MPLAQAVLLLGMLRRVCLQQLLQRLLWQQQQQQQLAALLWLQPLLPLLQQPWGQSTAGRPCRCARATLQRRQPRGTFLS